MKTVRPATGPRPRAPRFAGIALAAALGLALAGAASPAAAQLSIGVQASKAQKTDLGIGPRAMLELGPLDLGFRLVGSFEIYFPGQRLIEEVAGDAGVADPSLAGDPDFWAANLNLVYTLGLPLVPLTPYLGGGINFSRIEVRDTTDGLLDTERTDRGINVLAGLELDAGGVSPFFEGRYTFLGLDQWTLTGGIVF